MQLTPDCYGAIFDDDRSRYAGGLAGRSEGTLYAVYAHGPVVASDNFSTSITAFTKAGGLVGQVSTGGTLRGGYATGDVSLPSGASGGARNVENDYGKAVGAGGGTINYVYGSGAVTASHAAQSPSGTANKTESELKTPTTYGTGSAIYANWNFDIDNADGDDTLTTGTDDPWRLRDLQPVPGAEVRLPGRDARPAAARHVHPGRVAHHHLRIHGGRLDAGHVHHGHRHAERGEGL